MLRRAAIFGLALGAVAVSASAFAQTIPTIRVGWTIPAEEAKYWMMKRPDKFPNLGKTYNIAWSQFNGTSPMTAAMQAGALDCATQGVLPIAQSMAAGSLDMYVIAQHVGQGDRTAAVEAPAETVAGIAYGGASDVVGPVANPILLDGELGGVRQRNVHFMHQLRDRRRSGGGVGQGGCGIALPEGVAADVE